jgi:hypothetical protein
MTLAGLAAQFVLCALLIARAGFVLAGLSEQAVARQHLGRAPHPLR